jgi:DNA-binding TFAR19-related protein (PDSD5 family)
VEPITLLVSALAASAVGGVFSSLSGRYPRVAVALGRLLSIEVIRDAKRGTGSYQDQVSALTEALHRSGEETARLLQEMEEVARERLQAVTLVEEQLRDLETREQEASARLQRLQALEPEVAQDFAAAVSQLVDSGERISRRRDYILFLAGVLVSLVTFFIGLWVAG